MTMGNMDIGQITPARPILRPVPEIGEAPRKEGMSFGKVIKDVVDDAVKAEQDASKAIEDFASGKIDDVHDVVMAVGRANMAISLLVQIRNGILEAYQELSSISM
jgi:flagellar hook-basal body complex protein FliE